MGCGVGKLWLLIDSLGYLLSVSLSFFVYQMGLLECWCGDEISIAVNTVAGTWLTLGRREVKMKSCLIPPVCLPIPRELGSSFTQATGKPLTTPWRRVASPVICS